MTTTIHWALRSQRPGANADYQFARHSGGLLRDDTFAAAIISLHTGDLSPVSGRIDSAPSVAIGPLTVRRDGSVWLGMLQRRFAPDRDRYGRPIEEQRYFLFPYLDLSSGATSYLQMYRSVADAVSSESQAPLAVELGSLDAPAVTAAIDEYGFEQVAVLAAATLEAAVAIVEAGAAPVEERLRRLDAVLALLPYGYRATVSVATWLNSTTRSGIHLGFADAAREGQVRAPWQNGRPDLLTTDAGREYHDLLHIAREKLGTEKLIELLASARGAPAAPGAEQAVNWVRRVAWPIELAARLRDSRATLGEIRSVADAVGLGALPDAERELAFRRLAESFDDPRDLARLAQASDQELEQHLAHRAVHVMAWWVAARSAEERRVASEELAACIELALNRKLIQSVWRAVDVAGRRTGIGPDTVREFDTWLLSRYHDLESCPPELLASLIDHDRLVRLMSRPSAPVILQVLLRWEQVLVPAAQSWLAPYVLAAGRTGAITIEMVAGLADQDPELALLLLEVADASGHVDRVLPTFWEWLLGQPTALLARSSADRGRQRLGRVLRIISQHDILEPENHALLDVLLLHAALGEPVTSPVLARLSEAGPTRMRYIESFGKAAADTRLPERQRVLDSLRRWIHAQRWDNGEMTSGLLQLLSVLASESRGSAPTTRLSLDHDELRVLVRDLAIKYPAVQANEQYQQLWQPIVQLSPPRRQAPRARDNPGTVAAPMMNQNEAASSRARLPLQPSPQFAQSQPPVGPEARNAAPPRPANPPTALDGAGSRSQSSGAGRASVVVHWAFKSKRPDSVEDYQILGHSGLLSPQSFEVAIDRLDTGSLSPDPGRVDSAPGVAIGPLLTRDSAAPRIGLLQRRFTAARDRHGRPIEEQRYLLLSYDDVTGHSPTYGDLYAELFSAVDSLRLANHPNAPLQLPLTRSSPSTTAAAIIEDREFERLACLAALVLERPVAIVEAGPASVAERLAELDAVLVLLPYGYRAAMSVATWVHSATRSRIRLGFTDAAQPGEARVAWGQAQLDRMLTTDGGHAYVELLKDLRDKLGPERLIEILAGATAPVEKVEAEPAIRVLKAEKQPLDLIQRIHDNTLTLPVIRELVGAVGWTQMPKDVREKSLAYLAEHSGGAGELALLAEAPAGELEPHLVRRAVRLLKRVADPQSATAGDLAAEQLRDCFAVAEQRRLAPNVWQSLIEASAAAGAPRRLAEVLDSWLLWRYPDLEACPAEIFKRAMDPSRMARLLTEQAGQTLKVQAVLQMLLKRQEDLAIVARAWLKPLLVATGGPGAVDLAAIASMVAADTARESDLVRLLIATALISEARAAEDGGGTNAGAVDRVFPAVWDWHVTQRSSYLTSGRWQDNVRDPWRAVCQAIDGCANVAPKTRALRDTLVLYAGDIDQDTGLLRPLGASRDARDAYITAFVKAAHDSRLPDRKRIVVFLRRYVLFNILWGADDATSGLLELLGRFAPAAGSGPRESLRDPVEAEVHDLVRDLVRSCPAVAENPVYRRDWIPVLQPDRPTPTLTPPPPRPPTIAPAGNDVVNHSAAAPLRTTVDDPRTLGDKTRTPSRVPMMLTGTPASLEAPQAEKSDRSRLLRDFAEQYVKWMSQHPSAPPLAFFHRRLGRLLKADPSAMMGLPYEVRLARLALERSRGTEDAQALRRAIDAEQRLLHEFRRGTAGALLRGQCEERSALGRQVLRELDASIRLLSLLVGDLEQADLEQLASLAALVAALVGGTNSGPNDVGAMSPVRPDTTKVPPIVADLTGDGLDACRPVSHGIDADRTNASRILPASAVVSTTTQSTSDSRTTTPEQDVSSIVAPQRTPVDDPRRLRVGVWGMPGSGKTTYLAALASAGGSSRGWSLAPDPDSADTARFFTSQVELVNGLSFPHVTALRSDDTLEFLLTHETGWSRLFGGARHTTVRLAITDRSGAVFQDSSEGRVLRQGTAFLRLCDGILYFFDPTAPEANAAYFFGTLREVRGAAGGEAPVTMPLAVCVGKYDDPNVFARLDKANQLVMRPDGERTLPRVRAPRDAFEMLAPRQIVNAIKRDFRFVDYFVLSAAGFRRGSSSGLSLSPASNTAGSQDQRGLYEAMAPVGLLEPLLWLHEQKLRSDA